MGAFGDNLNWTTGIGVIFFESTAPDCSSGVAYRTTYPTASGFDDTGLLPGAVIPGASIVAKITKLGGFIGNITIGSCDDEGTSSVFPINANTATRAVDSLAIVQGQCIRVGIDMNKMNCPASKVEIEAALIGDFCARTPTISICKDHDANVTIPPALRATEGQDITLTVAPSTTASPSNSSTSTTAPSAAPKSTTSSTSYHSTRRILLTSLGAWLVVAVASL